MLKTLAAAGVAALVFSGCGDSSSSTTAAGSVSAPTTVVTTASTTTTTAAPTTTTTLPAPPTFVALCPAEATFGYFGKPTDFKIGYQYWVGTDTLTLDISWGDGKSTRFTSIAAFDKARSHSYEPGTYQVNALLTDAYGRTASSSCNVKWTDSLPHTMQVVDCTLRRNMITTYEPDANGFLQAKSVPDPSCAGSK